MRAVAYNSTRRSFHAQHTASEPRDGGGAFQDKALLMSCRSVKRLTQKFVKPVERGTERVLADELIVLDPEPIQVLV